MRNRHHSRDPDPASRRSQRTAARPSRPRSGAVSGAVDLANDKRSYEHFMALGRAAASAGDEIEAEGLYQRAEHHLKKSREQGT
jgi:hypothetical protein